MSVTLIAGLVFAAFMLAFAQGIRRKMSSAGVGEIAERIDPNSQWQPGERILREGLANHFEGAISNGGMLTLTQRRLRFRGHSFNVRQYDISWNLSEIQSAQAVMTAFIIPNGLIVSHQNGGTERFVVNQRKKWATAIEAALAEHRASGYRVAQ